MKLLYLLPILLCSTRILAQEQRENLSDSISHIEIYGETGKGDTAIIFFRNGEMKKVFLANEKARDKFHQQYKKTFSNPKSASKKDIDKPPLKNEDNSGIVVPSEIVEYTYNPDRVSIKLRNGKKEFYDLKDPAQKKTFMEKYNNFLRL
jgi:hypothetical protein